MIIYSKYLFEIHKILASALNFFKTFAGSLAVLLLEKWFTSIVKMSQCPTPRPVPDISKLPKYHYLPVEKTRITNTDDSKRREVDDYRARSKRVHKKNEINIEDSARVQTFCNRDIVEKSLVKKYLEHLNHLEMMSEKRKMEKKNKNLKENTQCLMRNLTAWKC